MLEDAQLLSQYTAEKSEAAFDEFAKRYVDLVYSAALRIVRGDVSAAQDVTQQVFTEVASQAKRLARHPALVGWLYTTTRHIAMRVNRTGKQRRQAREQEAYTMNELLHDDAPATDWNQLRPVIEDVMHELDDRDRHAILLRYFQNKSLNEIGVALNLNENAARMRIERAMDKLRGKLVRRGITTTASALAVVISANAVQAAPAGFVCGLSAAAIAGSAIHASTVLAATKTLLMTTFQKIVIATAVTAAVGTGLYAIHQRSELQARIQTLEQAQAPLSDKIQHLEQEHTQAAEQLAALTEENSRLKSGRSETELLKLRGQVGALRQIAVSNESKASQSPGGLAKMMNDPAMKDFMHQAIMEKMRSLYGDLIRDLKMTPEQSDQFVQILSDAGSKSLVQLSSAAQGAPSQDSTDANKEIGYRLHTLLGDEGLAKFKQFSDEVPARATLTLVNGQLGTTPLSDEQSAGLIQIIKAEPAQLTQGIIGAPDKAFLGSQDDIDNFLQQVSQSNQRILQQAGGLLQPNQLATLDSVLTKALENRKLQGAAFFPRK